MKKLRATIEKGNLISTLKNIEKIREDKNRGHELLRCAGFLEGILYTLGVIKPGTRVLPNKKIDYVEIGWLGGKTIKQRDQTYLEYMIELTQNLIDEQTEDNQT